MSIAQKSQWKNLFYCFSTKKTIEYKKAQDFLCSFAVILYDEGVDLNDAVPDGWSHTAESSSTLRMWI